MISFVNLALGALFALIAAGAASYFKLLTRSGALAAFLLGWIIFGLGGWSWAALLIAFFGTSSALSFAFKKRKRDSESMYAKGGTRDAGQVLANGGVAGAIVILHAIFPDSPVFWVGFCAALAAANADTWATELGVLNRRKPMLLLSGKSVEAGTSGAVSLVGTLAAVAGALLIGLLGWVFVPNNIWLLPVVAFSGLLGSLVDSALGASVQAIYFCPACQKKTEKHPRHGCGAETTLLRGWKWLSNDWVNLGCTLSASLVGVVLSVLFLVR